MAADGIVADRNAERGVDELPAGAQTGAEGVVLGVAELETVVLLDVYGAGVASDELSCGAKNPLHEHIEVLDLGKLGAEMNKPLKAFVFVRYHIDRD
jgi:hypothetical protein